MATRLTLEKNPEHQGLSESPWLAMLYKYCQIWLLGELSASHVTPLGEDNWKLKDRFPGFS